MVSRLGGAATGALTGAATGAKIGSVFPGYGTLIGAGIGALGGGLAGYFGTTPDEHGQVSTLTPQQQAALSQIYGNLQSQGGQGGLYQNATSYLNNILSRDPGTYERFAQPYMQQFESQFLPRLEERYAGLGGAMGGGVGSSSGFGQAVGGAGAQFQSNLAQLYANMQQNAASQGLAHYGNLTNQVLGTRAFEPTYQQGNTGLVGGLASGIAQGAGPAIGKGLIEDLMSYMNRDSSANTRTGIDQQNSPRPVPSNMLLEGQY